MAIASKPVARNESGYFIFSGLYPRRFRFPNIGKGLLNEGILLFDVLMVIAGRRAGTVGPTDRDEVPIA